MVGVLVFVILVYITINTLRSHHIGAAGPKPGTHLHPFAAPLVLSTLDGDANLAVRRDSGRAGVVPACSIRSPRVMNLCDLERARPLVLGFLFTRGAKCTGVFDAMERLRGKMPDVQFAGVVVRGDRDGARKLVRGHGWRFPVAFDRDGGVANVYGVAVCPELIFAYPGGVVRDTGIGEGLAADLDRRVGGLVASAKRRGWKPPA
jgi:hypothetical protein